MSTSKIEKLTPEQEALIPVYLEKWKAIALSTKRIDREKATKAVKSAYSFKSLEEPEIIFVKSPFLALNKIADKLIGYVQEHLDNRTLEELWSKTDFQLNGELYFYLQTKLDETILSMRQVVELEGEFLYKIEQDNIYELEKSIFKQDITLKLQIEQVTSIIALELFEMLHHPFENELEAYSEKGSGRCAIDIFSSLLYHHFYLRDLYFYSFLTDFWTSVLKLSFSSKGEILKPLIQHCGWVFPFETVCYVCDRPTKLSFDAQQRLHAEGEAAIAFSDGFSVYAYHGVRLPEKYGKIHPNQWQSKWLLEEDNAELKRVLIQGIGYERICQELDAKELDNWREYSLLRIDVEVDVEPIYLLKMTCPSTNHIHILRVPPAMNTAKEAIRWVNWEIDPEEFSVET